jgi:tRNA modification GTPase
MKFLYSDEPIIACSTGNQAHAAMAVLRISGFKDLTTYSQFFSLKIDQVIPRKVYFTKLLDEGETLDEICLTYFKSPKSYNGENILELSVHGNTLNVERIISLFLKKAGCRYAAPGEFTYRALKNKKLTLSQVEGLDLFLNANTSYALDQGFSLLSGNLQEIYQDLYTLFLKHKASLELSIDFSEDLGEEAARSHFLESLQAFKTKFETLYRRVQPLSHNLIQPEITLAGLPNSGKSSLFNILLADERAIVSPVAGTTRDYLSESIVIEGIKYKLIDTAGLRSSDDQIEAEGIRRTKKKLKESFFSILLINPLEIIEGFDELIQQSFDIIFFTHADLSGFQKARDELIKRYPKLGPMGAINLLDSSRNWEKAIFELVNKKYLDVVSDKPILLERHRELVLSIHEQLVSYENTATYEIDVAILSHELNTLGHCVSELIGIISPDQILNSIFSDFCIGK